METLRYENKVHLLSLINIFRDCVDFVVSCEQTFQYVYVDFMQVEQCIFMATFLNHECNTWFVFSFSMQALKCDNLRENESNSTSKRTNMYSSLCFYHQPIYYDLIHFISECVVRLLNSYSFHSVSSEIASNSLQHWKLFLFKHGKLFKWFLYCVGIIRDVVYRKYESSSRHSSFFPENSSVLTLSRFG